MNKVQKICNKIVQVKRYVEERTNMPLGDVVFWITFSLLLLIHCVENTSVTYAKVPWLSVMYKIRNGLYLVLLVKIGFLTKYSLKEFVGIVLVGLLGVASFIGSRDFTLLEFCIIAIAAKGISPKKFVTLFFVIKGSAVLLTLLLWRVGALSALYYKDDVHGYFNTYGFVHRNVLGANVAILCLTWFYLRYRKIQIKEVLVWNVICVGTYFLAFSKSSLLITLMIIWGMYVFQLLEAPLMNRKWIRNVLLYSFIGLFLLSLVCMFCYEPDQKIWKIIDGIFTKRASFANYCYENYGFSLFGQNIPFVSSMEAQSTDGKKLILDNSYMRAVLYYGIIPGGMFLFSYFKGLKIALQKKNKAMFVSLLILAVYGVSERYMLDVYYNIPLVVASINYFSILAKREQGMIQTPFAFIMQYANRYYKKSFVALKK